MTTPVDFDYNGPPVTVSNGMALQLVSQFGARNAWFAFLRMRGMKLSAEEAQGAERARRHFCAKIGHLRERQRQLSRVKGDEGEQFLSANFDTFLAGPNSLELREDIADVEQYAEVDEAQLERMEAQRDKEDGGPSASAAASHSPSLLAVIEQGKRQQERPEKEGDKTERESKTDREGRKEEIARRHAQTIDDVVSLVMEKIRNNQPFEGELNLAATQTAGTSAGGRPARGRGTSRRGAGKEAHTAEEQQFHPAQLQQYPPSGQFGGQQIVLMHGTGGGMQQVPPQFSTQQHGAKSEQQVTTILSNFSEIIRNSSTSTSQSHSHQQRQMAAPPAIATKLSAQKGFPLQQVPQQPHQHSAQHQMHRTGQPAQSHHQMAAGAETAEMFVNGTGGTGIPLEVAIQQNMTVQELIQTLKTQSRQTGAPQQIILQAQPAPASQMQQQQETPDSSSQEASQLDAQKLAEAKKQSEKPKKGRKRKAAEEPKVEPKRENRAEKDLMREEEPSKEQVDQEKKAPTKGRKPGRQRAERESPASPVAGPSKGAANEELDAQLRRTQKQLSVERNKAAGQKKRVDKLQAELEKALDQIQLLQIDLACQKTDNNNLIAENIALKAENQQLRSKGHSAAAHHRVAPTTAASTSSAGRGRKRGGARVRGGKRAAEGKSSAAPALPERTQTPPPLSNELGRRQSKRICVARTQFMKKLF